MGMNFFKHGITLYQKFAAVAVTVYALSVPTLIASCIVMKRANPSWASLAAALATVETGLMVAAVVIRSVLTGQLVYRLPVIGILYERLKERPVGFRVVMIVFALLAICLLWLGCYGIAHRGDS
jgi:hypothetical protein